MKKDSHFFVDINQKILKELVSYNPKTGLFVWKYREIEYCSSKRSMSIWNAKFAGKYAFNANHSCGYKEATIFNKKYLAHRLAWLYVHGEWPENIDHIDGDRKNNRINNLRSVSRLENQRNLGLRKDNKSGHIGVYFNKNRNAWESCIVDNGKTIHIGIFDKIEDAVIARSKESKRLGYHINHGTLRNNLDSSAEYLKYPEAII